MISKRIFIDAANDNYARLAAYIADAGHKGEKNLLCWCAGCAGDDYQDSIAEVLDVQALNTRTQKGKTYHLIISFRPEDEARLTPEVLKAIEERFAVALGYTDHQRHCSVHKNTSNLHMHVAYNMVHPEKHTVHKEYRDFWIRSKLCRELEQEYGLVVDVSKKKGQQQSLGDKAALIEAHTGQQSFESYAKGHREEILQALEAATGWQSFHESLALYGMEVKPYNNGLAFKDRHDKRGKHSVKISAVDRSLSRKKLEARLGSYQPPQNLEHIQERERYSAAPLHCSPERGQLFAEYKTAIDTRKTTLQGVKEQEDATLAAIRAEWAAKRRELEQKNIAKKNLRRLLQLARKHEAEALVKAKVSFQEPRNTVRQEIPFTSWNGFLQHKAEQGNEIALAVLRSREQTVSQEQASTPTKDWSQHGQQYSQTRAEYSAKECAILENTDISAKGKKQLQAILRMEQVTTNFQHHVDRKGTVIFTLQGGGKVRDSGTDILFSANSETAKQIALRYVQEKWGKKIKLEGNLITRHEKLEQVQALKR